jgi:hypothetical protein
MDGELPSEVARLTLDGPVALQEDLILGAMQVQLSIKAQDENVSL